MIDFGFDKIALIGAVALIVIGPEKLPKVARTVGHLVGKAQRYMADVKAEVNRSIELDELKKMKSEFETAAHDVKREVERQAGELESDWSSAKSSFEGDAQALLKDDAAPAPSIWEPPPPVYRHPGKNWRVKRGAVPGWYKQRAGVRSHVQSGAARVARFRPRKGDWR